jgi:3-methyladenine DNA glycosylase Tag
MSKKLKKMVEEELRNVLIEKEYHDAYQGQEGKFHRTKIASLISDATMLLDLFDDSTDLPEWLTDGISIAYHDIHKAVLFLSGEESRKKGRLGDS